MSCRADMSFGFALGGRSAGGSSEIQLELMITNAPVMTRQRQREGFI